MDLFDIAMLSYLHTVQYIHTATSQLAIRYVRYGNMIQVRYGTLSLTLGKPETGWNSPKRSVPGCEIQPQEKGTLVTLPWSADIETG